MYEIVKKYIFCGSEIPIIPLIEIVKDFIAIDLIVG
jgi:hypothetical protein